MFHIRQADHLDMQGLRALYKDMGYAPDAAYFEKCFVDQENKGRILFVVESSTGEGAQKDAQGRKALIGFCILNWYPRYKLFKTLGIPEIQDLCVVPSCRGQGLGSALIAHCEGRARDKGHKQMGIGVGLTKSFGAAQRLYAINGYLPDGYGAVYDREYVREGDMKPVDPDLNIMMIKDL